MWRGDVIRCVKCGGEVGVLEPDPPCVCPSKPSWLYFDRSDMSNENNMPVLPKDPPARSEVYDEGWSGPEAVESFKLFAKFVPFGAPPPELSGAPAPEPFDWLGWEL